MCFLQLCTQEVGLERLHRQINSYWSLTNRALALGCTPSIVQNGSLQSMHVHLILSSLFLCMIHLVSYCFLNIVIVVLGGEFEIHSSFSLFPQMTSLNPRRRYWCTQGHLGKSRKTWGYLSFWGYIILYILVPQLINLILAGPDAVKFIIDHSDMTCVFCTADKLEIVSSSNFWFYTCF